MTDERPTMKRVWLAVTGLALVWRLITPVTQRFELRKGTITDADYRTFLLMGAMGLAFLTCGVVAHRLVRSPESRLFGIYAALAAIHWGGPVSSDRPSLILYFLLSGILADTVLFHFVLLFQPRSGNGSRRRPWGWLYLPAAVAAGAGLLAVVGPGESAATGAGLFQLLHLLVGYLFVGTAIVVAVTRTVRAAPPERGWLALLVAGLVLGNLPYLVVMVASGDEAGEVVTTVANLFFVLIPLGGCVALLRSRDQEEAGSQPVDRAQLAVRPSALS